MAATGHRKQGHSRLHAPIPKHASETFSYFTDLTLPGLTAGVKRRSLYRSCCLKLRKRVPTLALVNSLHRAPSSAFWERRTLDIPLQRKTEASEIHRSIHYEGIAIGPLCDADLKAASTLHAEKGSAGRL